MRSAKTRTLVTEESSKRAAFTIPVLSLNTVIRPSDGVGKADPTSVSWAMASPARVRRRVSLVQSQSLTEVFCLILSCFLTAWIAHWHQTSKMKTHNFLTVSGGIHTKLMRLLYYNALKKKNKEKLKKLIWRDGAKGLSVRRESFRLTAR